VEAARQVAGAAGVPLDALRIGHLDGDLFDPRCTWLRHREFGPQGAILVRPDRFIAWRSLGASSDPAGELTAALGAVLGRPVPARA
jgi:2,4-dichlorophenol 6-monooxygenase